GGGSAEGYPIRPPGFMLQRRRPEKQRHRGCGAFETASTLRDSIAVATCLPAIAIVAIVAVIAVVTVPVVACVVVLGLALAVLVAFDVAADLAAAVLAVVAVAVVVAATDLAVIDRTVVTVAHHDQAVVAIVIAMTVVRRAAAEHHIGDVDQYSDQVVAALGVRGGRHHGHAAKAGGQYDRGEPA